MIFQEKLSRLQRKSLRTTREQRSGDVVAHNSTGADPQLVVCRHM